jgi:hypothetical protein
VLVVVLEKRVHKLWVVAATGDRQRSFGTLKIEDEHEDEDEDEHEHEDEYDFGDFLPRRVPLQAEEGIVLEKRVHKL